MIFIIGKYAYVLNKVNFGQGSASVKFDSITIARLYRTYECREFHPKLGYFRWRSLRTTHFLCLTCFLVLSM